VATLPPRLSVTPLHSCGAIAHDGFRHGRPSLVNEILYTPGAIAARVGRTGNDDIFPPARDGR